MLTEPVSLATDHICGPHDALVTLVEYGDYQCPHCRAAHLVIKGVMTELGDAVRYVFRHFPMTTIHPDAETAAESAEAAASQHRFWEMHDLLFANQHQLDAASLHSYAMTLGLDVSQWEREIVQHEHLPKVSRDFTSGVRSGVNGTPTFFVNGARHDGDWGYDSLMAALQRPTAMRQRTLRPTLRVRH